MDFDQTIVALSTPAGVGALAIVRLSGPQAFAISKTIFRNQSGHAQQITKPHQVRHGHIHDPATQDLIDEVVITAYASPNSYTGEDIIEISCHGNPLIANRIVCLCLEQGARLAQSGEFTRRAFLSGKLDLTQAEAVLDLIQAKTTRSSQSALSALKGDLGREINTIREELKRLLTNIVASIDFPDEVNPLPQEAIERVVEQSLIGMRALAATARTGKYLRDGLKLTIVGRPNAGKSSLLNRLLKVERAIVTNVPGTTRDSLSENFEINGIPIILTDTAGIRPTDDLLEQLGIERTRSVLADSQLVLLIADITCGWQEEEKEIIKLLEDKPWFLLWNKIDLKNKTIPEIHIEGISQPLASLPLSAKTGQGIEQLAKKIEEWVFNEGPTAQTAASLNTRQAALCRNSIEALQLTKKTLTDGLPHDCLTTDLKLALDNLSEIAGQSVSEEVISAVFSQFCIGK